MKMADYRVCHFVLIELAFHADEHGLCYPGNQRLGTLTHYAPTSVDRALSILSNQSYIKKHTWRDPVSRRSMWSWQISPYVLYIRDENFTYADTIWTGGINNLLTQNIQPESTNQNHNQNQEPESNQLKQQQQSEMRSITPPPDETPDEDHNYYYWHDPDDDSEYLHRELTRLGCSDKLATEIQQTNEHTHIMALVKYVTSEKAQGIYNKMGFIRSRLESGDIPQPKEKWWSVQH